MLSARKISFLIRNVSLLILINIFTVNAIDLNNIRFVQSEVNNLLPSRTIFSLNHDKNGMLWIGTNSGLSRYDGYNIETFYVRNNQISSDVIYRNYLDSKGRLWILTEDGINQYHYDSDSFTIYMKGDDKPVRANAIAEKEDTLILGTSSGLFRYDETKDEFVLFDVNGKTFTHYITSMATDSRSNIWFAEGWNIYCYDINKNILTDYSPKIRELHGGGYFRINIDSRDRLWINFHDYSVAVFDPGKEDELVFLYDDEGNKIREFKVFEKDDSENVWIGSDNGIHIFSRDLKLARHIVRNIYDDTNISDNSIYSIYNDKSGNIWVGTYFAAINQYISGSDNIKIYSFGYTSNHLTGNVVRQIIEDRKGRIWIAIEDGGLNILDGARIDNIELSHKGTTVDNVHTLLRDSNDDIWIGTYGYGLYHYSVNNDRFSYFEGCREKMIYSLKEDDEGNIWIGTTTGIFVKKKNSAHFEKGAHWTRDMDSRFCYSLLPDREKVWIGTFYDGLYLLDTEKNSLERINTFDVDVKTVYIITKIKDEIWVASNNGVLVFNSSAALVSHYSIESGLPSNEIKTIVEDNNGTIWITTNSGLCFVDSETKSIDLYTDKDGLPANQFNFSSGFISSGNKLFFGSFNGMISFYPDNIKKTYNRFPIILTSVNASGEHIKGDYSLMKRLDFSFAQARSIYLEFSGMNYKYLNNTRYKFRLDGVYNQWQETGKSHLIQFYNLNPGNYTLTVVAGAENEWDYDNAATIEINIRPPFWRSIPAYILYALILLTIMYLVYLYMNFRLTMRMKLKAERDNLKRIEEMNMKRTNFFSYISHDLRTPLTLIISPLQQLSRRHELDNDSGKKISIALNNAKKINSLIDQMLLFSKSEDRNARITVAVADIRQTAFDIISGFEFIAKERKIDFIYDLDIKKQHVCYSAISVERIIYNLLSNALKFTPEGGTINLNISDYTENGEDFIRCEVADTGRGISENKLGNIFENYYQLNPRDEKSGYGLGLPLVRNLITLHKGDITIESREGQGTKISFFINVSKSAFEETVSEEVNIRDSEEVISLIEEQEEVASPSEEISDGSRNKILIVEDNVELNNYLKDILSTYYNVDTAFDGEEGYEKASDGDFDLILSDVMMPKMDGNEFAAKIKSSVATSHILVILLSAKIEPDAKSEGFSNGADAYLSKPFNPEDLLKMIANLLKTRDNIINRFKASDDTPVIRLGTSKKDEEFLNKIESLIFDNIQKENFGIEEICAEMKVSRSLLYLKLKKLTDSSASEFIKTIKMKEAKKRMMEGHNVSEASYLVGIYDPNYFTKCFKKQFGIAPSEFIKQISAMEKQ